MDPYSEENPLALYPEMEASEKNVAAWIRGFGNPSSDEWQAAENVALKNLLGIASLGPDANYPANGAADIPANVIARALANSHRATEYDTDYLATLSALAYAGAGNFPSAAILAYKAIQGNIASELERWMMRFLADLRTDLVRIDPPASLREYARSMNRALSTGISDDFDRSHQIFIEACQNSDFRLLPNDRYLLLLWSQVHSRLRELSVARVLREIAFPHQGYAEAILRTTSPLFFPPQAYALQDSSLVLPTDNMLLSLPTSTGKSLLGELALVASLQWNPQERWLAVYLAPYRALTDQLYEKMWRRLRRIEIACIKRRGNYLTDMATLSERRPTILIATPEAFDGLLRQSPELYSCLSACVFDEFHLIEQHQRGLRYEGLIGRFLHGAAGQGWPKLVALSAVVDANDSLIRWMEINPNVGFYRSNWKPTGRRIAVSSPQGRLDYFTLGENGGSHDAEEPGWQGTINIPHLIEAAPRPPTQDWQRNEYNNTIQRFEADIRENIAAAAIDQYHRFRQPVMVIATSRNDTQLIATTISSRLPRVEPTDAAPELAQTLSRRYPYLFTLQNCLKHGVAYHNASLPDWVRGQIEQLIMAKQVAFVVATTTLAEGVDMPFRVVVMADWESWLFGQRRPMPTLLFHNISGRSGRAWEYIEGDTIIVDNPGRNADLRFADRYREYINRYVRPSPYSVRSSVEWSIDGADEDIRADTAAVLESQFAAYIAVCGQQENPETAYADSMYSARTTASREFVEQVAIRFTSDMLADREYPVLQRNSPLSLTPLGNTVVKTGLSPRSGVALARFFSTYSPSNEPSKDSRKRARLNIRWEPILAAMWEAAKDGSWVQELETDQFRRHIKRTGNPATPTNFPTVLMAWISGVPVEEMAWLTLRKRELQMAAERWLNGDVPAPGSEFENWIERLAVLCSGYLAEQWSWVVQGSALICIQIGQPELAADLEQLGRRLRSGVAHIESAELLSAGCPLDRAKLDWLVNTFKLNNPFAEFSQQPFRDWLSTLIDRDNLKYGRFPILQISNAELIEIFEFLRRQSDEAAE
ncbi:MAG: hypothetical protein DCC55_32880 [Chloroflexi bacterium]|nr:MAG: hypothetical protein DCC55_32880 [Chloroflexota bacterium]